MISRPSPNNRRRGATAVETALVLLPLIMFLCGIFEYGRLFMDWNLLENAAREGCRYALANNQDTTISTDVTSIVTGYMAGRSTSFSGFSVSVSGTHTSSGVTTSYTGNGVNALAPGDVISVTVSGNYQFMNIIPLVSVPNSFTVTSTVTMICEGGV
ncbi:MAG TPA: TadE/TadG family type IV pilus assembly protein [Gemmataceae bacterium]|nr:TadE/TadG family type IV pilus assembly protein [Gemmataceae bacterium]